MGNSILRNTIHKRIVVIEGETEYNFPAWYRVAKLNSSQIGVTARRFMGPARSIIFNSANIRANIQQLNFEQIKCMTLIIIFDVSNLSVCTIILHLQVICMLMRVHCSASVYTFAANFVWETLSWKLLAFPLSLTTTRRQKAIWTLDTSSSLSQS